jgi:hypothetical protein
MSNRYRRDQEESEDNEKYFYYSFIHILKLIYMIHEMFLHVDDRVLERLVDATLGVPSRTLSGSGGVHLGRIKMSDNTLSSALIEIHTLTKPTHKTIKALRCIGETFYPVPLCVFPSLLSRDELLQSQ